jgi:hypothetical protein
MACAAQVGVGAFAAFWHTGCTDQWRNTTSERRRSLMAHSTAVHAVAVVGLGASPAEASDLLYKADHPRAIDRYIDFFGDGALSDDCGDGCGELFLESLA